MALDSWKRESSARTFGKAKRRHAVKRGGDSRNDFSVA